MEGGSRKFFGFFFPAPASPSRRDFFHFGSLQLQTKVQTTVPKRKQNKAIDWSGVERDYRAGVMGVREIARWYGISDTAVHKKAKAEGWERKPKPESPFVQAKAQRTVQAEILLPPAVKPEAIADRARLITGRLLDELDAVTAHAGELEEMICSEESDPRRRQALLKAVSLSERASTLKNLATAMKTLNEAATPGGKKDELQRRAEEVASRFGRRPQIAVDNTK